MRLRQVWLAAGVLAILIAVVALVVYLRVGNPFDPIDRGREPVTDEYVGQTKASVIGRYGLPTSEWNGCYGKSTINNTERHPQAVTLIYMRLTGYLRLSFDPIGNEWVCFCSDWIPNDIVID